MRCGRQRIVVVREMRSLRILNARSYKPEVAPRVGAWVETSYAPKVRLAITVAPRVGAWVETKLSAYFL